MAQGFVIKRTTTSFLIQLYAASVDVTPLPEFLTTESTESIISTLKSLLEVGLRILQPDDPETFLKDCLKRQGWRVTEQANE